MGHKKEEGNTCILNRKQTHPIRMVMNYDRGIDIEDLFVLKGSNIFLMGFGTMHTLFAKDSKWKGDLVWISTHNRCNCFPAAK